MMFSKVKKGKTKKKKNKKIIKIIHWKNFKKNLSLKKKKNSMI